MGYKAGDVLKLGLATIEAKNKTLKNKKNKSFNWLKLNGLRRIYLSLGKII